MIRTLESVAVVVGNAKKAAQWYRKALGLVVKEEGHWVTAKPKGAKTCLHLCEGDELEPGNTGILFFTKDLAAEYRALQKKGVKFTEKPKKESWGTYAMFQDPDGNVFWLMEG